MITITWNRRSQRTERVFRRPELGGRGAGEAPGSLRHAGASASGAGGGGNQLATDRAVRQPDEPRHLVPTARFGRRLTLYHRDSSPVHGVWEKATKSAFPAVGASRGA
jgi:hypothetical protein